MTEKTQRKGQQRGQAILELHGLRFFVVREENRARRTAAKPTIAPRAVQRARKASAAIQALLNALPFDSPAISPLLRARAAVKYELSPDAWVDVAQHVEDRLALHLFKREHRRAAWGAQTRAAAACAAYMARLYPDRRPSKAAIRKRLNQSPELVLESRKASSF